MIDFTRARRPTIGVVAALPAEFNPVLKLISSARTVVVGGSQDQTIYTVGTMPSRERDRPHVVVVTMLSGTGNTGAAHACANLTRTFPSIRYLLMVGTAAGVPNAGNPEEHVRLGDIVVAAKGVAEYDHVDDGPVEQAQRGQSPPPAELLVNCARTLQSGELDGERPWERWIDEVQQRCDGFARPSEDTDVVYASDRARRPLVHPPRDRAERPRVHQVRIGSGNMALGNIARRDDLAARYKVSAFDMETAGLARSATQGRGWLAVRGISDYGDARRKKAWRNYASLAAAAYVRALLAECPPQAAATMARWSSGRAALAWAGTGMALITAGCVMNTAAAGTEQITDRISVHGKENLRNGVPVTITLPAPPEHRYLDLTIELENPDEVGDCVHAATMDLVPVVDGHARPPVAARRPGEETRLDLDDAQHTVTIVVTVDMPDQTCRADLSVDKAVLRD